MTRDQFIRRALYHFKWMRLVSEIVTACALTVAAIAALHNLPIWVAINLIAAVANLINIDVNLRIEKKLRGMLEDGQRHP